MRKKDARRWQSRIWRAADMAEALEDAFRYGKIVLAAPSYDAGVMPVMADFLHHLQSKNYQKRTVALIENGSWAPSAARTMKGMLDAMKEITVVEPIVTVRGGAQGERYSVAGADGGSAAGIRSVW